MLIAESACVIFLLLHFGRSFGNDCQECCNLVYRTRVRDWPEMSRRIWAAHLEWYLDDQELQSVLGRVDRFEVRHGRMKCWGGPIEEKDAHYVTLPGVNASMTLHKLSLGFYGVQICTFSNHHPPNTWINWNNAWVGSMDIGNLNGHGRVKASDITNPTCVSEASIMRLGWQFAVVSCLLHCFLLARSYLTRT